MKPFSPSAAISSSSNQWTDKGSHSMLKMLSGTYAHAICAGSHLSILAHVPRFPCQDRGPHSVTASFVTASDRDAR